jgi:hypothetical protein
MVILQSRTYIEIWAWWDTAIIPTTLEATMRVSKFEGKPKQIVNENLSQLTNYRLQIASIIPAT